MHCERLKRVPIQILHIRWWIVEQIQILHTSGALGNEYPIRLQLAMALQCANSSYRIPKHYSVSNFQLYREVNKNESLSILLGVPMIPYWKLVVSSNNNFNPIPFQIILLSIFRSTVLFFNIHPNIC